MVGGLLLGGVAFAADVGKSTPKKLDYKISLSKEGIKGNGKGFKDKCLFYKEKQNLFKETLSQMVKDGTLDQKKSNEISAYIQKKQNEQKTRMDKFKKLTPEQRKALFKKKFNQKRINHGEYKPYILNQLVKDKILTQKQASAFTSKYQEITKQKHQENTSLALKDLVNKNVINQGQADKVTKELENFYQEKKDLNVKLKDMTKEQKREFFNNHKKEFKNPIANLVQNKVITVEQADKINEALGFKYKKFHRGDKTTIKLNILKLSRIL